MDEPRPYFFWGGFSFSRVACKLFVEIPKREFDIFHRRKDKVSRTRFWSDSITLCLTISPFAVSLSCFKCGVMGTA